MGEASRDAVARTHADTLHNRYLQRVAAFGAEGALKWLAAEPSFASITLSSAEPGGWRELAEDLDEVITHHRSRVAAYRGQVNRIEAEAYAEHKFLLERLENVRAALQAPNPPSPENVG